MQRQQAVGREEQAAGRGRSFWLQAADAEAGGAAVASRQQDLEISIRTDTRTNKIGAFYEEEGGGEGLQLVDKKPSVRHPMND